MRQISCWLILITASLGTNIANAGYYISCEWVRAGETSTPEGGTSITPGYSYCTVQNDGWLSPDSPDEGFGGGGGGDGSPSFTDVDVTAELQCALDNYLHNNVRLTGGRSMKKVSAWAFGTQNSYNVWGYKINSANISPGAGWTPVAGIAYPNTAYGRLYNLAFQANTNFPRTGSRPDAPSNALTGSISSFEMSLFTGAHEASHLRGNLDENEADWYGINAVLNYRSDGGAKCPN